ncbi:unnamed protein product [Clonostachys byssicola]|uniref:Glucose-methanol-choline oxidoreductase N-terminal domain-containing protein n=1 Tax=Clonostachys byssicola TaxID=160290 RepID=A0A9N9XYJ6_9HYPO|nr:unnamed protein product [Clonostachys byssicola]
MKAVINTGLLVLGGLAAKATATAEYDYVVIGSGPGGGPLAANLAREGHSVFLIEAGGDRGDEFLQQVPRLYNANAEHPEMSWQFFVSHYQNETQARRDRYFSYRLANGTLWYGLNPPEGATPRLGIYYPRGATVGGSAISNAMNVVLPPPEDFDYIARATGDDSWRGENLVQYYEEFERNTYTPPGTDGHGYDGYIATNRNNISYLVDRPGIFNVVQNAMSQTENIDLPDREDVIRRLERDLNRPDLDKYEQEGVYQVPVHIDEKRRRSSPWNYITETLAAKSANGSALYPLTLSTHSLATKVVTSKSSNGTIKAVGVEYLAGEGLYEADRRYDPSVSGEKKFVKARKEVIVAGGAFNTPQILKLSGLGPREELESHGIETVVDLPAVGEYLQDNYEIGINVQSQIPWENNPAANCTSSGNPDTDPCLAQWVEGYGPYGEGASSIFMLYRSSQSENNDTDLIIFGGGGGVFDGHYPGYSTTQRPPTSFFWVVAKMQNHNPAGTVRLRSADPREVPQIDFNFFEQGREIDLTALSEGLEHVTSIMNAMEEPYAPFTFIDPPTDRSLSQHILDHTFSHHALGSCRIGRNSTDSCVDSNFKVHGVEGLRVVDGSVFPRAPGGFPVGSTFLLGQKAFRVITQNA